MCIFFKVNVFSSDYFWAMWFQVGVLNPVLLQHSWLFTGINCWWNSEKRAAEWVVYFFDKQNIFRDKGANYKLKKGPLKSPHLMQSSFPSSFNEQGYPPPLPLQQQATLILFVGERFELITENIILLLTLWSWIQVTGLLIKTHWIFLKILLFQPGYWVKSLPCLQFQPGLKPSLVTSKQ